MIRDTDIFLQGPLFDNTYEVALSYVNLEFVQRVIISTWLSEADKIKSFPEHKNIKWVLSPYPEENNPLWAKMNFQLASSMAGALQVSSPKAIKMRTDQHIYDDSMNMMNRFFNKFSGDPELEYENGLGPIAPIFVIGMMGGSFPYHPQDHVFWGYREDIIDLFNIPFIENPNVLDPPQYTTVHLREPIYLGAHYCSRFNSTVKTHLDNYEDYLLDISPKRSESMELSSEIKDKVFKVFPRINMYWTKYNSGYWYHEYESQAEYYYDEPWE